MAEGSLRDLAVEYVSTVLAFSVGDDEATFLSKLEAVHRMNETVKTLERPEVEALAFSLCGLAATLTRALAEVSDSDPLAVLSGHVAVRDAEALTNEAWMAMLLEQRRRAQEEDG